MWMLLGLFSIPDAVAEVPPPVVTVGRESRRRGGGHRLRIEPPQGLELDGESPVDVLVVVEGREVAAHLPADPFVRGLPMGDLGLEPIEGTLRVVLCDKATNVCTRTSWALAGTPPDRGEADFALRPPGGRDLVGQGADLDRAVEVLTRASERSPEATTFDLALVQLLVEEGRPADALAAAERAMARASGDIGLRVALWHAKALAALDRRPEAEQVVKDALSSSELDRNLDEPTQRYRNRLEAWLQEQG